MKICIEKEKKNCYVRTTKTNKFAKKKFVIESTKYEKNFKKYEIKKKKYDKNHELIITIF